MPSLFTFSGRLGRLAYFGYTVLLVLLGIAAFLAISLIGGALGIIAVLLTFAVVIGLIWSALSLGVRRLHDLDISGWYYVLILFVPGGITSFGESRHSTLLTTVGGLMSLAFTLFLAFWPGTRGRNSFD
jgi:uncharacterized membrane protein YhaH (DUF805 family)